MSTTMRPLSPGAKERHKAHMEAIRKRRQGAPYEATDVAEGEIELNDSEQRITTLEERIDRIEELASGFEIVMGQQNQKLDGVIDHLRQAGEALEALKGAKVRLDEEAMEAIATHMEACFLKASERASKRHAEMIREHVLEGVRESIEALKPKGSGFQKFAAVMSVVGGVVVTAMAGTYLYAVSNYTPPEVHMHADGSAAGAGGAPLGSG